MNYPVNKYMKPKEKRENDGNFAHNFGVLILVLSSITFILVAILNPVETLAFFVLLFVCLFYMLLFFI